jgi:hypothetical protein
MIRTLDYLCIRKALNIGNEQRRADMRKVLLSNGVELVGNGSSCSRAGLTLDDSYTLRASSQHAGMCTAAPSKYERTGAPVIALVDLLRRCTAQIHRESVNHSNGETGGKVE